MHDYNYWLNLTRSAIRGVTPENARLIALQCLKAEKAGQMSSVWHESAIVHGHKCNCGKCNPSKKTS